ncbi:MAG: FkbM family methyltransferase [Nostocales cyanobacterium ELA583]|jgi:hypothetical protein
MISKLQSLKNFLRPIKLKLFPPSFGNFNQLNLSAKEKCNANISFSQFGEDLIIIRFLRTLDPSTGIYIDCGAFDPITISNTLLLHKKGYKGINIDIDQDKIDKFNRYRPNDYNILAALSNSKQKLKLLKYYGRATNRIISLESVETNSIIGEQPIQEEIIETSLLTEIIDSSPFSDQEIHYLNVDCEGHDLNVLMGLDFSRYTPKLISVEVHSEPYPNAIQEFLFSHEYRLVGMTDGNKIFASKDLQWES